MSDINLLATTDAKVWAAEFMRMHGDKLPDEGLMIAWFANMWAATYDPLQAEIERLEGALRRIESIPLHHVGWREIAKEALDKEPADV